MVRVLCYAVGIISWPVSKVLDYVLGNEHTVICLSPFARHLLPRCACWKGNTFYACIQEVTMS